jgi:hypothetical protein
MSDQPRRVGDFKPTKAEARAERQAAKDAIVEKESRNKSYARKRDGWMCRFPRCGCHAKRLHPEVAHIEDKKMGGDHGERSTAVNLICLCPGRHRESLISLHAGTLRCEVLTVKGANAKVRWWVNAAVLDDRHAKVARWVVVATETRPGYIEPLTKEQGELLTRIAELQA